MGLPADDSANFFQDGDVPSPEDAAFLKKCEPDLEALEAIRLTKLGIYRFRKMLAVPGMLIVTPALAYADYWLLLLQAGQKHPAAGLSIAFVGALYWWVMQPRREYARAYKEKILPKLVRMFGNFYYDPDRGVNMSPLIDSKILPRYDRCEPEDYFRGEYKGVGIEFSEINLKQKRRSKNRTYYVSVFRGVAILIDLRNKKFLGHTILQENRSKIGQWFEEFSNDLKRANMVDPEFEKMFDVYTNDQVEARWLIDPVIIERLKGLSMEYNGERMEAAWFDSKMLILVKSRHDHFEPANIYVAATDPEGILSMKREIGQIVSIIDKLQLYDKYKIAA